MPGRPGSLTISLDFELYWGVRDKRTLENYGANLLGARQAIPRMLDAFTAAGVKATWATVGFLFFDEREELLASLPNELPTYDDESLSPYPWLGRLGVNEAADPYHFGLSLVRRIQAYPEQEIGSHTFSHYYCLEHGQTAEQFRADLRAAKAAAGRLGIDLRSLVFPRNQVNGAYLGICAEEGFNAVRGNPQSWIHRERREDEETKLRRGMRLVDSYLPLGSSARALRSSPAPVDVPASRFLRPINRRLGPLNGAHIDLILGEMTKAARQGLSYHLWWHPHNFGVRTEDHMARLGRILAHYRLLADRYGMASYSMGEAARSVATLEAA